MLSTMMHTPMTVRMIFEHGSKLFPRSRICSFDGEKIVYENFFETTIKVGQLANALSELGVEAGDRVGTFSCNNTEHMQAYLAVPSMGAVMHTINIRLSPEQIAYVINHAQDKVLIVDGKLLNWFEPVWPLLMTVEHVLITRTRETDFFSSMAILIAKAIASASILGLDASKIDTSLKPFCISDVI